MTCCLCATLTLRLSPGLLGPSSRWRSKVSCSPSCAALPCIPTHPGGSLGVSEAGTGQDPGIAIGTSQVCSGGCLLFSRLPGTSQPTTAGLPFTVVSKLCLVKPSLPGADSAWSSYSTRRRWREDQTQAGLRSALQPEAPDAGFGELLLEARDAIG